MEATIIEKEALRMTDHERAVLADRLLESLIPKTISLEKSWIREADDRMKAYQDGMLDAIAGPESLAELRNEFPR